MNSANFSNLGINGANQVSGPSQTGPADTNSLLIPPNKMPPLPTPPQASKTGALQNRPLPMNPKTTQLYDAVKAQLKEMGEQKREISPQTLNACLTDILELEQDKTVPKEIKDDLLKQYNAFGKALEQNKFQTIKAALSSRTPPSEAPPKPPSTVKSRTPPTEAPPTPPKSRTETDRSQAPTQKLSKEQIERLNKNSETLFSTPKPLRDSPDALKNELEAFEKNGGYKQDDLAKVKDKIEKSNLSFVDKFGLLKQHDQLADKLGPPPPTDVPAPPPGAKLDVPPPSSPPRPSTPAPSTPLQGPPPPTDVPAPPPNTKTISDEQRIHIQRAANHIQSQAIHPPITQNTPTFTVKSQMGVLSLLSKFIQNPFFEGVKAFFSAIGSKLSSVFKSTSTSKPSLQSQVQEKAADIREGKITKPVVANFTLLSSIRDSMRTFGFLDKKLDERVNSFRNFLLNVSKDTSLPKERLSLLQGWLANVSPDILKDKAVLENSKQFKELLTERGLYTETFFKDLKNNPAFLALFKNVNSYHDELMNNTQTLLNGQIDVIKQLQNTPNYANLNLGDMYQLVVNGAKFFGGTEMKKIDSNKPENQPTLNNSIGKELNDELVILTASDGFSTFFQAKFDELGERYNQLIKEDASPAKDQNILDLFKDFSQLGSLAQFTKTMNASLAPKYSKLESEIDNQIRDLAQSHFSSKEALKEAISDESPFHPDKKEFEKAALIMTKVVNPKKKV